MKMPPSTLHGSISWLQSGCTCPSCTRIILQPAREREREREREERGERQPLPGPRCRECDTKSNLGPSVCSSRLPGAVLRTLEMKCQLNVWLAPFTVSFECRDPVPFSASSSVWTTEMRQGVKFRCASDGPLEVASEGQRTVSVWMKLVSEWSWWRGVVACWSVMVHQIF